eukprot:6544602-Pyramimonas_sp.AAC.1
MDCQRPGPPQGIRKLLEIRGLEVDEYAQAISAERREAKVLRSPRSLRGQAYVYGVEHFLPAGTGRIGEQMQGGAHDA